MVDDITIDGKKVGFNLVLKKHNDPFSSSLKKASVQAIENELGDEVEIKGNINIKVPERIKQPQQQEKETSRCRYCRERISI